VIAAAACSGSHDAGNGATTPPTSAGVVWVVDTAANSANVQATMTAFANGLHVMVIDGDDIYAGMNKLATEAAPGGGRLVKLSNGLTAQLVPAGNGLDLHFSSGETVHMRQQALQPGAKS
jgi:hypothetical protein